MTVMTKGEQKLKAQVAVSVQNVNMTFDGFHAVDSASFELKQGRFLTILGPSGSGKTTLLRMIAGFQKPTAGEIFINGAPVGAAPPHKRSIGMVFQKLALFPHMTAAENVAFPLKMRRFDATTIPERVKRYLDLVQLGPYADRRVHQLSGGQQQRVAIARALVFEPDLLLLDEPLAALDRKLREEMQLEFRRIQRELGVTTINVTHDQREALVVSDDVVVMDKGRIQQMASPTETYRTPANAFVAGFIGVTNFLNGKVTSVNGSEITFAAGERDFIGHWGAVAGAPTTSATVVGALRAEQVRMAATADELAGCRTVLSAKVSDAIFEGERTVYEVTVGMDGNIVRVFDHDPAAHKQFGLGEAVSIGWNPQDVLIYPN
ncbi:MAG: ABC transporter ATP-binding protein [Candidatus Devosia phytovorans]|uniref:ABC transporter ATP-binding protein n=1 Tax=Candidatus Devosia phytovorans TaxID=3121372 RepID=A0AAJ6B0P5_9HYPH|nr:ABC transporter ATP-binding protein [Devosia sp.]WEK04926.1 MAG: ABC transporter ATP-binding protein [Devosia sp.]